MRNLVILLLLVFTISCTSQSSGQVKSIGIQTLKAEVIGKDVQLVDVRTSKEYDAGHIEDAINIDVLDDAVFTEKFQDFDKEKPIYIYCQMGGRSKKASQKLKDMGFKTIFDYSGGYGEWSGQK